MNTQLSRYQFIAVVINFLIFSSILMAPAITVVAAKQDGWLSMLLALVIGLLLMALYLFMFKKYNYPSLFELMDRIAGKWIGTLVNLLIIFYALHLAAMVVRNLSNFMVSSVVPYSHPWIYQVLTLIAVAYAAALGVKVIFLLNEMLFPFVVLFTMGSLLLILREFNFFELKPFFHTPPLEVFQGAYVTLGFPFIEILLLSAFLQFVEKKEKLRIVYLSGITIGGMTLAVTVFLIIGDEGAYLVARETYPTFSVMRDIEFFTVFERIEILLAVAWLLGLFVKITACFLVGMLGLKHLSKSTTYKVYIIPIGILVWAMSNHLHKTVMDFSNFVTTSWTFYWFSLYCLIILVLAVGILRKKHKMPASQ
ncbi:germination protein [Halobacillus andaensis]|uniref:Germination protein n=1 Tax=Halobacillus andaensis TaxID=1176239 RepID=A0A917EYW8_HALAA|nr:endospore germination permease [Halobacillus andaensis]MBP2005712.1 spore germination protein (amino acid permease) [Halobacillus andaensis]GGF26577.1 germination protein [Halobacillus andaensis]